MNGSTSRVQAVSASSTRRVVMVGYADSTLLDIASVSSTLYMANRITKRPLYEVEVVSPAGCDIVCDAGHRAPRYRGTPEDGRRDRHTRRFRR